jgi:hypothetical protein
MSRPTVPLAKQSKRRQKEYHAKQRRDWGPLNPATRTIPNAKAYNRKKSKHGWNEPEPRLDIYLLLISP